MKDLTASQINAKEKIRDALALIESAQGYLESACECLSRVSDPEYHWEIASKLHDQIEDAWRIICIGTASRSFDMDSDWKRKNPNE